MTTLYAVPDVKVNIYFLYFLTDYAFVPVLGHVGRYGERYANRKLTTLRRCMWNEKRFSEGTKLSERTKRQYSRLRSVHVASGLAYFRYYATKLIA